MAVPAQAIERFKRLKARADDIRAALHRLHDEREQVRGHLGKLEAAFQMASRGRNYIVGDDGELYQQLWHEEDRREPSGTLSRRHRQELKKVQDEGLTRVTADVVRARQEMADLEARRQELGAQVTPLDALVNACRRELVSRGWREGGRGAPGGWALPAMAEGEAA